MLELQRAVGSTSLGGHRKLSPSYRDPTWYPPGRPSCLLPEWSPSTAGNLNAPASVGATAGAGLLDQECPATVQRRSDVGGSAINTMEIGQLCVRHVAHADGAVCWSTAPPL